MKIVIALVMIALVAVVSISGCTQTGPTGELTSEQMDEEAFRVVDQEIENTVDQSTMEELENSILEGF